MNGQLLVNNNLLSKHQFGFVSGRSTVTQLLVTLNEWLFGLDNNVPIDAAYMDFRKAFDTVPHQRLLNKLKGYKAKKKNYLCLGLPDRLDQFFGKNAESNLFFSFFNTLIRNKSYDFLKTKAKTKSFQQHSA